MGLMLGMGLGPRRGADCWLCLPTDKPVDQHNRQKMLEVVVSPAITCKPGWEVALGAVKGWGLPGGAGTRGCCSP